MIGNAVFEKEIVPIEEISPSESITSFGYIGSVIELEGLDFVIQAFSEINQLGIKFQLHIIGDGNALPALKQLATELNVPVFFHGRVPFSDIQKYYKLIDCVINYRRNEIIAHDVTPLKPLEGIAQGKLIICSDVGGMREILGEQNTAIFVPPNNPELLSRKIVQILRKEIDTYSIKKNATRYILTNRVWEKNVKKYIELYSQIYFSYKERN